MASITASETFTPVVLEPAAQAFAEATANPPYLYDLAPQEGRKVVDDTQSGTIDTSRSTTSGSRRRHPGPHRPARGRDGVLPVILYIHGAGWVFGNAHTHDRLVRELAVGTGAAVVSPSTACRPRPATRSRSSRSTRSRAGSRPRARPRSSTPRVWSSPATRSAATWPRH